MFLTKSQRDLFWKLWSKACRYNGWTAARGFSRGYVEERRRELLKRAGFDSLTKVDRKAGFDRVKAELLTLTDNVDAALETMTPGPGNARRYLAKITREIVPCLALYTEFPLDYCERILSDRFKKWETRQKRLDELTADQLHKLLITLSARLNDMRNQAGDTLHEMKTRAGVPCGCKECLGERFRSAA